jgi:hypothetical protein
MAKQAATSSSKLERTKKKRPGVHSKSLLNLNNLRII